jgi:hypothetical protein
MSFVLWIFIHLLLRPAMEARGEGGGSMVWESELTGDRMFLLLPQAVLQWSTVGH